MITIGEFWEVLIENEVTFFSGVPCSILENILGNICQYRKLTYIDATREDASLGLASGASIAGRKAGILIQNSGLGNIINGLTSFNLMYKIPVLMFITWRGDNKNDSPEHYFMGKHTLSILKELTIPTYILRRKWQIGQAVDKMNRMQIPVAILLKENIVK